MVLDEDEEQLAERREVEVEEEEELAAEGRVLCEEAWEVEVEVEEELAAPHHVAYIHIISCSIYPHDIM